MTQTITPLIDQLGADAIGAKRKRDGKLYAEIMLRSASPRDGDSMAILDLLPSLGITPEMARADATAAAGLARMQHQIDEQRANVSALESAKAKVDGIDEELQRRHKLTHERGKLVKLRTTLRLAQINLPRVFPNGPTVPMAESADERTAQPMVRVRFTKRTDAFGRDDRVTIPADLAAIAIKNREAEAVDPIPTVEAPKATPMRSVEMIRDLRETRYDGTGGTFEVITHPIGAKRRVPAREADELIANGQAVEFFPIHSAK